MIRSWLKNLVYLGANHAARREYENQKFTRFNERPVEFSFLFQKLSALYPQTILDVGTGTTALPHLLRNCGALVTAIDNITSYWPKGVVNRHYWVLDDDILNPSLSGYYDCVCCISVLEHIQDHVLAVKNMAERLNPGGHLILTCPYNESSYCFNVYELQDSAYGQDNPFITQSFSRTELNQWISETGLEIVEQEVWQFWDGKLWTQGHQIIPPRKVDIDKSHQLTCLLLRKPHEGQSGKGS